MKPAGTKLPFCVLTAYLLMSTVPLTELSAYQTKKRTPQLHQQRASGSPSVQSYSTHPFDIDVSKLPPNYRGHDIVACYNRLRKAQRAKGEYETSAQYVGRTNSLSTDYLSAFKVEPHYVGGLSFDLEYTYDADRELLVASLEMKQIPLGLVPEYEAAARTLVSSTTDSKDKEPLHRGQYTATGIKVLDGKVTRDSYVGSNAYGARKMVTRFVNEDYNIAFDKDLPQGISWLKLTLPIAPTEARALKPRLGVLVICKVKPFPYAPLLAFEYYKFLDPTIHSPIDSFTTKKCIHTELKAIWLYDVLTGTVLVKHTPQ